MKKSTRKTKLFVFFKNDNGTGGRTDKKLIREGIQWILVGQKFHKYPNLLMSAGKII
jgi:hypothetical protein